MSTWTYSASTESNLMKVKYGKLIEKQFNMENVLFGRMKKMNDFVGSQIERPVVQSIGGGVGSGSLPTASENKHGKATISSKKLYAVTSIDRESMKAAKSDEGSFVRFTSYPVKIASKSFNRNLERMFTRGDASGSGAIITGDNANSNVTGNGAAGDPYVITFDSAGVYNSASLEAFEEGDLVNINSETDTLEVVEVAPSSTGGTISLVGGSIDLAADTGSNGFQAADKIYIQGSKDNECIGLEGVLSATSGSLYGITVGRRWQSVQKDASAAAISTDLMNEVVINLKKQCGESPKFILSSYKQFRKLLDLLEDQKRFSLPARDKKFKATISFSGVEYMSADGAIPVFASRYVDDDKMYFLNDDHIELHLRPGGFEWFDEDGTVFLRESSDSYEARYGGYGELFVNPHFQGYLHNLA